MTLRLFRTAVHKYDDGSEGVLEISLINYENGGHGILVGRDLGDEMISIHGRKQMNDLIDALRAAADKLWED